MGNFQGILGIKIFQKWDIPKKINAKEREII